MQIVFRIYIPSRLVFNLDWESSLLGVESKSIDYRKNIYQKRVMSSAHTYKKNVTLPISTENRGDAESRKGLYSINHIFYEIENFIRDKALLFEYFLLLGLSRLYHSSSLQIEWNVDSVIYRTNTLLASNIDFKWNISFLPISGGNNATKFTKDTILLQEISI